MEENKLTFSEAQDRIKSMMNYNPEIPLTEQSIRDLRNISKTNKRGEISYAALKFQQQLIMKSLRELNRSFKQLQGKTYEGHDAVELIKTSYKEKTGKDMVIPESMGKTTAPPEDGPEPTQKPLEIDEVGYTNVIKRI